MKKLISIALAGFICIASAGCNSNQKKDKEVVQEVKKPVDDQPVVDTVPPTYSITAPEGWIKTDSTFKGTVHTKIASPDDGPNDRFKENINVNSESAKGYDAKSYAEANFTSLKNEVPDVVITDLGATTIGDIPAECYNYSFNYRGVDIKDIAWYLVKNDIGYVITATAIKSTYDKFEAKFRACANTFIIK